MHQIRFRLGELTTLPRPPSRLGRGKPPPHTSPPRRLRRLVIEIPLFDFQNLAAMLISLLMLDIKCLQSETCIAIVKHTAVQQRWSPSLQSELSVVAVVMLAMLVLCDRAYCWATGRIQKMTVKPTLLFDGTRLTVRVILASLPSTEWLARCPLAICLTVWKMNDVILAEPWISRLSSLEPLDSRVMCCLICRKKCMCKLCLWNVWD